MKQNHASKPIQPATSRTPEVQNSMGITCLSEKVGK